MIGFRQVSHTDATYSTNLSDDPLALDDFLRQTLCAVSDFCGCDSVAIQLENDGQEGLCRAAVTAGGTFRFGYWPRYAPPDGTAGGPPPEFASLLPDPAEPATRRVRVPLQIDGSEMGVLWLCGRRLDASGKVEPYGQVAQILAIALAHHRDRRALRERVKELSCLYGITRVIGRREKPMEDILEAVVAELPPGWQYPEHTAARITVDNRSIATAGFERGLHRQSADIVVAGRTRGAIDVVYTERKPDLDEGPFLKEERKLIDSVAGEIALLIERKQADEERARLQSQILHADRLATIGQLAAGVAHELNDPLGNIIGFAQLAKKCPGVPDAAAKDIEKIIAASLHAREVISKLLMFARQKPPQESRVNLNSVVEECLGFLAPRCSQNGIEVERSLCRSLPPVAADPTQMHQVLVNLVVNAIQAMPEGGQLEVRTEREADHNLLVVRDTGRGMTEDVLGKIFLPFFSTKDVGEGTGLGLAVVHGIVSAHRGTIDVASEVGRGTRFEIRLPRATPSRAQETG